MITSTSMGPAGNGVSSSTSATSDHQMDLENMNNQQQPRQPQQIMSSGLIRPQLTQPPAADAGNAVADRQIQSHYYPRNAHHQQQPRQPPQYMMSNGLCQSSISTHLTRPLVHQPTQVLPPERSGNDLSFPSISGIQLLEEATDNVNISQAGFLSSNHRPHIEEVPEKKSLCHYPEHLKMKEWMKKVGVLGKENEISPSHAYVTSSLKIAHSLADQLCALCDERNDGETPDESRWGSQGGNNAVTHHVKPPEGLHWTDFIIVHLKTSKDFWENNRKNDDDPTNELGEDADEDDEFALGTFHPVRDSHILGDEFLLEDSNGLVPGLLHEHSQEGEEQANDLQGGMNDRLPVRTETFGRQSVQAQTSELHHKGEDNTEEQIPDVDYLNIASAKLQMETQSSHTSISPPSQEDKWMYIYYLGLVFSELFSGGICCGYVEDLGPDPLSTHLYAHSDSRPTDIGNATSIIDDLGDDDELFGGGSISGSRRRDEGAQREYSTDSNRRKKKNGVSTLPASSFTIERLKSLGLPTALCDLIGNMIDCKEGDFSVDETYSSMTDVRTDLSHMLENPDVYLRDLDLSEISEFGLQMDDMTATCHGRDMELASLKKIYLRSISGKCEAAMICGHNGIGKSSLAHEFTQHANTVEGGCILLSGKFDNLQQSLPFSPIASAYNNYCKWLSQDENASMREKVSDALNQALGQEANALVKVIPNLSNIIDGKKEGINESDDVKDAQKRIAYLFRQLTDVISRSHNTPLILYMDNLQWADLSSIALIKQILLASLSDCATNRFFFLGCSAHGMESRKDQPIWTMLDSLSNFGLNTTKIELRCLDNETVNTMISKKLNLLPRLTIKLTDIVHHKTKGNPFFIKRLMIELGKENLLRPSLSRRRWEWEEEKIQERELPDDVVLFLTASLNRLPSQVILALSTLSCFGSCSDQSLVELENELGLSLSIPLDYAVAEGFLNKKDEKYHFVDDRVRDAAYSLMKPHERCLQHFSYGLILCSVAVKNDDDGMLLLAVGQINLGGPRAGADDHEHLTAAKHNLAAGKKSMEMSDFLSAYWFFDFGISFMKKNHWEDHYQLSLDLFNGAAECALVSGEYESLSILSEQIMHFAKSIEDKHQIFHITVCLLLRRSNLPEAINCCIDALSTVGEDFPDDVTPDVVIHFMEDTEEMLEGMSEGDLINHKRMSNKNKLQAMKFFARLSEVLYMIRPSDQPVVVLKMVQLSLEHGMSPISPLAFVSYGSLLASMGDIRQGYRYALMGKILLKEFGSRQVTGETIAHFAQLMACAEPVQSAIEFHIEGRKAAMSSGAPVYAMLNALLYDSCSYWSGKNLCSVKSQMDKTIIMTKQYNLYLLLVQLMPLYGSVLSMIGDAHRRPSNEFNTEKLECDLRVDNPFQSKAHYFNKMYTAFIFRNYDSMKAALVEYSKFKIGSWIFVYSSIIQTFYEGLISFWIGRREKDNTWIERGKDSCRNIEKLVESASGWNCENKEKLLQAEEQLCEGNFELAETLYDSAVYSAKTHRFVNEEALANELAGEFFLEMNRNDQAKICFSHAIEKYDEWGAFGKTKSLREKLRGLETNGIDRPAYG